MKKPKKRNRHYLEIKIDMLFEEWFKYTIEKQKQGDTNKLQEI